MALMKIRPFIHVLPPNLAKVTNSGVKTIDASTRNGSVITTMIVAMEVMSTAIVPLELALPTNFHVRMPNVFERPTFAMVRMIVEMAPMKAIHHARKNQQHVPVGSSDARVDSASHMSAFVTSRSIVKTEVMNQDIAMSTNVLRSRPTSASTNASTR